MDPIRHYEWAGLTLESPLELPELCQSQRRIVRPDLVIRLHAWSTYRPKLRGKPNQSYLQAIDGGGLLLRAPGYAQFFVHASGCIDVRLAQGAHEAALRAFILGPVLAAVAYLRGWVGLHAGALVVDGRAKLFCGDSGAGKSTLVAYLAGRGHQVICDDVCVLDTAGKYPAVRATDRSVKLWPDSLLQIQAQLERLNTQRFATPATTKAKIQFGDELPPSTSKLDAIYELTRASTRRTPTIVPLSGARALELIIEHSHRKRMIGVLDIQSEHLQRCIELARRVRVFKLVMPDNIALLAPAITALEASWQESPHTDRQCDKKIKIKPSKHETTPRPNLTSLPASGSNPSRSYPPRSRTKSC